MPRNGCQTTFAFKHWGGARLGAGRKPSGPEPGVSHSTRSALASRYPVHVTTRLRKGLPSLRRKRCYRTLCRSFRAGKDRFGFRLNHFSIQSNHLHLVVEAKDRRALSRGMQGLLIRVAKALNRLWDRRGSVFADRYHDRILRTPREVRQALAYVLNNARRHGISFGRVPDPYSSGPWFDGWRDALRLGARFGWGMPVVPARTWLQKTGWRRWGRIKPGVLRSRKE